MTTSSVRGSHKGVTTSPLLRSVGFTTHIPLGGSVLQLLFISNGTVPPLLSSDNQKLILN